MKLKPLFLCALIAAACTPAATEHSVPEPSDVVMYQVNPRVFAARDSFNAVSEQLDAISDIGANVLWFMPLYPIGEINTVNSPYCIRDYRDVNPEFGTIDSFKQLIDLSHSKGMSVIVDWVANHTSWDNAWISEHPDWYTQDAEGNIISPEGTGWLDVADLDFDNPEMRLEMIESMKFWVNEIGVDGFRCDAADFVPFDFWKQALDSLRAIPGKNLLMLAEGQRKDHFDAGFDMNYAWRFFGTMHRVYDDNLSVTSLIQADSAEYADIAEGKIKLRFTTNHDEAAKNSPLSDFDGEDGSIAAFVASTFIHGGMLVYGSQEVAYPDAINFFHYVPVDWSSNPEYRQRIKDVVSIYKAHPALRKGCLVTYPDDNVLMFDRTYGDESVFVAVNMRPDTVTLANPHGGDMTLAPYEYKVETRTVTPQQITRVEPLSWWTGMKNDLQVMIQGPSISTFDISLEGLKGVSIRKITKAENPDFVFIDVNIAPNAQNGTCYFVFKSGKKSFRYPYRIAARNPGSAERTGFNTSDVIYLIVPDRFANGDPSNDSVASATELADRSHPFGRHGGDIQGIIDHLDYIQDLGATAIWNTPILEDNAPRGSYHGYACSDYYHIDPRYGSNELYRTLTEECHKRGIKMIMDFVTNHSSTEHWWMEDRPFSDWVHTADPYVNTNHMFSLAMDPNASKADKKIMEEGWFVGSMPDMNLDNPFMLKYFQMCAIWWIEYAGLDGIRVDTYFYNEKEPMSRWAQAVMTEYPDFNIVGECWSGDQDLLAYWQTGHPNNDGFDSHLPSIMDFPLRDAINQALVPAPDNREGQTRRRGPGMGGNIDAVYRALAHDATYTDLSHMLLFLSNHDTERIGDVMGENPQKIKLAFTLLATLRGIPQMFYGDEMMFSIHRRGRDDGRLRMDFPGGWEGDAVNLFTEQGRRNADGEYAAAAELHDYVSTLLNWRKDKEVIHSGKTLHFIPQDNTYGYFRYNDTDVVFVFINNSSKEANVPWSRFAEIGASLKNGRNVITGEPADMDDSVKVGPDSALIVEFKK